METVNTTTKEKVAGCASSCSSGGCNRLNVHDWLNDMVLPPGQKPFDIIEVRFKGTRKEFFRNPELLSLKAGDVVAVEGNPGHDIGIVSLTGELVKLQMKKRHLGYDSAEIKLLYRTAKQTDIEKWNAVKAQEDKTMHRARSIALHLGLKMKLSDVEYQGDGKKAIFYYTAEDRVDFRELIKRLADEFKIRVEMKQIGLRQEAGRLGGIGSCGRELCCSTWLTDFKTVGTAAARYQNLSINPVKLAGQCGKLKCCLNYELDSYMDALKDIPDSGISLQTETGNAMHRKTDIFKRLMWYELIPFQKPDEKYFSSADKWVMLTAEQVKEILAMNKAGKKPVDLKSMLPAVEEEEEPDYADMVGQDSLTRMDNRRKKKKKKKPHHHHRPATPNNNSNNNRNENKKPQ